MERVSSSEDLTMRIHGDRKPCVQHSRKHNAPTFEVELLTAGDEFESRNIIVEKQDESLRKAAEISRQEDKTGYVLCNPKGAILLV